MWQRFTERARKVVFFAQEEAARLGENYVSTEHMLLGLLREPDSVAGRLLVRLGLDPEVIRVDVDRQSAHGDGRLGQDMQLTPRAKRVIDLAYDEAKLLNNNYIGTEHLLLGLIREDEGLAGRVLVKAGAELGATREAVRNLHEAVKTDPDSSKTPVTPDRPRPVSTSTSINRLISNALFEARELGYEQPSSEHFLLALFTAEEGKSAKVLESLGLSREMVLMAISDSE